MSAYDVAIRVRPYQLLAGQPFSLGWAVALAGVTLLGTPFDVSTLTDVRITAQQRVPRGLTAPAATVWTLLNEGGITVTQVTIGGAVYPYVWLVGAAPAAGVYDVDVALVSVPGRDWLLRAVFETVLQP